ncbi:DnaJ domain-containing protein [Clostridium sp.]|uniref:DnaJ domain-containing protein n=1 Tax=Clostridium sp. TaxID=1506 RepID=UPI003F2D461B
MKYLKNINTLEELKKEYRKLVIKYHPDNADGDEEIIKTINNEYDILFNELKNKHNKYKTQEMADDFKDIINKIVRCEGISIEIIGNWVWVTGNTKEYKDILKEAGFFWASKKAAWYWRADKYKSSGRGKQTLDEIREKYGSDKVKTQKNREGRLTA